MKADYDDAYQRGEHIRLTPAMYKRMSDYKWLRDVDSLALANVQLNIERAYNDYRSGKSGKPQFKKKHVCRDSYTTNKINGSDNVKLDGCMLKLPKVKGSIRLRCHRTVPETYTLKGCTVVHEPNGKWMFSLLYEYERKEYTASEALCAFLEDGDMNALRHIGLDMSLPYMYIDSDGNKPSYINNGNLVEFSKHYHRLEKRIAREQRRLSRMVKDSSNYRKQCIKIARLHAKAKHQRTDFIRQIAVRLARNYDIISIEDLNIAAIKKSLSFGKSVSDNGWGMFVTQLSEKCSQYGTALVKIDRFFPSSKLCSHCGHIHKELTLSDRTYICPVCGNIIDRDAQAAHNIDIEGMRMFLMDRPSLNINKNRRNAGVSLLSYGEHVKPDTCQAACLKMSPGYAGRESVA